MQIIFYITIHRSILLRLTISPAHQVSDTELLIETLVQILPSFSLGRHAHSGPDH